MPNSLYRIGQHLRLQSGQENAHQAAVKLAASVEIVNARCHMRRRLWRRGRSPYARQLVQNLRRDVVQKGRRMPACLRGQTLK
jgi:hypothetical protein